MSRQRISDETPIDFRRRPSRQQPITVGLWIHRTWHKTTDKGTRYYAATLHQDLWEGGVRD